MPEPIKVKYRDLSPELQALLAGGKMTEGAMGEILKQYRKKTDVIAETDIAVDYRSSVNDKINQVKIDLDNFIASLNVIPEDQLSPEFLQRISNIELQIASLSSIDNIDQSIRDLQSEITTLKNKMADTTDLDNIAQKIDDVDSASKDLQDRLTALDNDLTQNKQSFDADIQQLRSDLSSLQTVIESTSDTAAIIQRLDNVDSSLREYHQNIIELQDSSAKIQEDIATLKESANTYQQDIIDLQNANNQANDNIRILQGLSDDIQQDITSLKDVNNNIKQSMQSLQGDLNTKRSIYKQIEEADLDEGIKNKLAQSGATTLQFNELLNTISKFSAGHFVSKSAYGDLVSKALFYSFFTTTNKTLQAYMNDTNKAEVVIDPENGKVYEYGLVSGGKNGAPAVYNYEEKAQFFDDTAYWNSFLIDYDTNEIFGYVTSSGVYKYYPATPVKKSYHVEANGSVEIPLTLKDTASTEVFVKDTETGSASNGFYVNAEAYVDIAYGDTKSKLISYYDQPLDVIVLTK